MENTMENAGAKDEKSLMDVWTENTTEYWSKMLKFYTGNGKNGNGTMKSLQNTMKSSMNIWKSLTNLMTDPATMATLPKAASNIPSLCLEMQQREMERFFLYQSGWMEKTEHYGKLSRLVCRKAFS